MLKILENNAVFVENSHGSKMGIYFLFLFNRNTREI